MKSIPKLIKRFIGILMLSSFLILVINFIAFAVIANRQAPNRAPWAMAQETADSIKKTNQGYILSDQKIKELEKENVWAIYIDNKTGETIWHSENIPETIPLNYTISDVSDLTRGYIDDYPAFTGEGKDGLMILGYPKDSFWKHMWPSWDYHFIANFPKIIFFGLLLNVFLIFCIYLFANTKLLKSVKPITDSIKALPTSEPISLKEKGILSEISTNLNRTSEILLNQKYELRKKETARANWIAGVSHDIRTPLSMVMGYASQLKEDANLNNEEREKADVIVKQSERIKNLINDLNIASKLEYNMQPINPTKQNLIPILRQVVVDFMNTDIEDKYKFEWQLSDNLILCSVKVDKDLLKRAISNIIQNCINHNEQGCTIYINAMMDENNCTLIIADDGVGITDEQLTNLNNTPHYMVCDNNSLEQRHGLGLLIVKQIIDAHGGSTIIKHSKYNGFEVKITLPSNT